MLCLVQTREEIIASREKRLRQLENALVHTRKKIADHYSGRNLLKQTQLDYMEQNVNVYQHQIEELERELDEDVSTFTCNRSLEFDQGNHFRNSSLTLSSLHFFIGNSFDELKEIQHRIQKAEEMQRAKMRSEL